MSGNHSAHSSRRRSSNSTWKIAVLVVLLIVVIGALGFLLWQLFGAELLGGSSNATADIAPGIFTQVEAEYGNGKNVAGNLTVTQGTQRPESIPETEDVILLDIAWTGKKEPTEPMYITVSDPSFTDGDGLAVYDTNESGQWEEVGQYEIHNNSVTFMSEEPTSYAFQVLSANPLPVITPEPAVVTPEPTATPLPTPEPTPAPIAVVDYGAFSTVQTGAFVLANELQDDETYVVAMVQGLPDGALDAASADEEAGEDEEADDAGTEEDGSSDGGLTISYVDAPDAGAADAAAQDTAADAAVSAPSAAPVASVLLNMDGTNMTLVDMPLIQDPDGTWCLAGPITDGMLWSANRDAYKDEHRFSLKNNDGYLNLDDSDQNVLLNDNSTRTRWLVETADLADGTQISTLNYRNDSRYYISQFGLVAEALPSASSVAPTQAPDGTTPDAAAGSAPVYVGVAAPADTSAARNVMRFSVSEDQTQALQLVLFKLDKTKTAPEGFKTILEHNIIIPEINETTNLSTLAIRDGDTFLQLGVDYFLSARVVDNDHVVVVIQFMGNYAGQIVRTYPGTTIVTNETPAPSASPEPSPTPAPTPYVGGEAAPPYNEGGGDNNNDTPEPPACDTNTEVEAPPGSTGGGSGGDSDTDTGE